MILPIIKLVLQHSIFKFAFTKINISYRGAHMYNRNVENIL